MTRAHPPLVYLDACFHHVTLYDIIVLTNSSSSPGLATSARFPLVEASDNVSLSGLANQLSQTVQGTQIFNYFVSGWVRM